MPAAYTHFSIAGHVLSRIPSPPAGDSEKRLYFFGAQGADFCFFYRALHTSETNFGRYLHNRGSYGFFRTLFRVAAALPPLYAYALGYITHYAADAVFHPYIYSLSSKSPVRHSRAEGALDLRFRDSDGGKMFRAFGNYFNCPLESAEIAALYALYSVAAADGGRAPLKRDSFLRSLSRFRAYTSFSARAFAREYPAAANEERREWRYPADPVRKSKESADDLFLRATAESIALIVAFRDLPPGETPDFALFGKNFLTGI